MDDVTIFVVDDDPATCESLRFLLESDAWRVETCCSGPEFLARDDARRAACLILDLHMPEMDGLQVQKELAARGCRPPVIFVSGYGDVRSCVEAMKQGATDFVQKPVDGDRLLRLVRKVVRRELQRRREEEAHRIVRRRIAQLTANEKEVMQLLLRHKSVPAIAAQLRIGEEDVTRHRSRILETLLVKNEVQLLRLLLEHSPENAGAPPSGYETGVYATAEIASVTPHCRLSRQT